MKKTFTTLAAATLATLSFGTAAYAATLSCTAETTYELSDATQVACFSGNDTNQIDANFSLFGMTGWLLSDKNDDQATGSPISFVTAPTNGSKSGNWVIDTLAGAAKVVITLKAGNSFGAFLLDQSTQNPLTGSWASGKGLSHASIYYLDGNGGGGGGNPPLTPVPLPASALLLLGALGGLAAVRRKRS